MDQNRLKMRISRMFRSSFGSCRTRNLSDDVTENAPLPLLSPKAPTFPSICRPKCSHHERPVVSLKDSLPRRKVSEWPSPFNGRSFSCPPVSPISPPIFEKEFGYCEKTRNSSEINRRKNKKKGKKKKKNKRKPSDMFLFGSCNQDASFGGYWWYSSDDEEEGEDETDTLFSSRSFSSDSSRYHRRRRRHRRKKKDGGGGEMDVMPLQGKAKDTFAVVKRSMDPYNDFRTSMVEMIVEKQIFSPMELENLLQCFLSLNSNNHHKIIVEVFMEIWETLFSDWF